MLQMNQFIPVRLETLKKSIKRRKDRWKLALNLKILNAYKTV